MRLSSAEKCFVAVLACVAVFLLVLTVDVLTGSPELVAMVVALDVLVAVLAGAAWLVRRDFHDQIVRLGLTSARHTGDE